MAGTFKLLVSTVATKVGAGWTTSPGGLTTDAALANAAKYDDTSSCIQSGAQPISGSLSFNTEWYLDGSIIPTPFANLPAGFNVLSAILTLQCTLTTTAGYSSYTFTMFFSNTESRDISNTPADRTVGAKRYYDFTHPLPVPTALHLNTDAIGFSIDRNGAGIPVFQFIEVNGTYETITFNWAITNSGTNFKVGDTVHITANSVTPLPPLTDITELTLTWADGSLTIPSTDFLLWTLYTLDFVIPVGLDNFNGDVTIDATVVGTYFTGTATIGTFTIIVANASGIYRIVLNKTNDTIYIDHTTGQTTDVAIPQPFFKTGFIGG